MALQALHGILRVRRFDYDYATTKESETYWQIQKIQESVARAIHLVHVQIFSEGLLSHGKDLQRYWYGAWVCFVKMNE